MTDEPLLNPSSTALADLLSGLRKAKRAAARPETDEVPRPDLQSVAQTLLSFHTFLLTHPEVAKEGLDRPLQRLIVAFGDLAQGRRPGLLEPFARKKPKGISEQVVMAVAALALDEMVVGQQMPVDEGAAKVARTIEAAKLPVKSRDDSTLTRTVIGYRQRLMTGEGAAPPMALHVWQDYRRDPSRYGATSAERVTWLLKKLREGPALRWQ